MEQVDRFARSGIKGGLCVRLRSQDSPGASGSGGYPGNRYRRALDRSRQGVLDEEAHARGDERGAGWNCAKSSRWFENYTGRGVDERIPARVSARRRRSLAAVLTTRVDGIRTGFPSGSNSFRLAGLVMDSSQSEASGRGRKGPSSNIQAPEKRWLRQKLQTPSVQVPEKHQTPNLKQSVAGYVGA